MYVRVVAYHSLAMVAFVQEVLVRGQDFDAALAEGLGTRVHSSYVVAR